MSDTPDYKAMAEARQHLLRKEMDRTDKLERENLELREIIQKTISDLRYASRLDGLSDAGCDLVADKLAAALKERP
jgi:hypothetical protein